MFLLELVQQNRAFVGRRNSSSFVYTSANGGRSATLRRAPRNCLGYAAGLHRCGYFSAYCTMTQQRNRTMLRASENHKISPKELLDEE